MEYVAFLFLGLGVVLIIAGLVLQKNEEQSSVTLNRIWEKTQLAQRAIPATAQPVTPQFSQPQTSAPQPVIAPIPSPAPSLSSIPGSFQFISETVKAPEATPVSVQVAQNNPKLFEKFAYLYLDSSGANVYDGSPNAAFNLKEVGGIRRFGKGVFSYDGFMFSFDHQTGQERFPLGHLQSIAFYPNCVALTSKSNRPIALLFMEETDSIRKVVETFKVDGK